MSPFSPAVTNTGRVCKTVVRPAMMFGLVTVALIKREMKVAELDTKFC